MPLSGTNREIFDTLQDAIQNNRTLSSFVDTDYPDLSFGDAYEIQAEFEEIASAEGDDRIGYKMGLTSRAKQESMGLSDPVYGRLFESQVLSEGEPLDAATPPQPRVEPEVGIKLEEPLAGPGVTGAEVLEASAYVFPSVEVLNSRYENYDFNLPDVIADNTSAHRFYVGSRISESHDIDLTTMGVIVEKNGRVAETGAGGAILGNPVNAVSGLANLLARQGRGPLEAGQLVLTGGITDAVPVEPGDQVKVTFQDLGSLSFVCQ